MVLELPHVVLTEAEEQVRVSEQAGMGSGTGLSGTTIARSSGQ